MDMNRFKCFMKTADPVIVPDLPFSSIELDILQPFYQKHLENNRQTGGTEAEMESGLFYCNSVFGNNGPDIIRCEVFDSNL